MAATASLRMSTAGLESFEKDSASEYKQDQDTTLALLLTVDLYSTIRLYLVQSDLCELVFQVNLTDLKIQNLKDEEYDASQVEDIQITSIDLLLKARVLLITTADGQILFMSQNFELKQIEQEREEQDEPSTVSESLIFDHKDRIMMALGYANGSVAVQDIVKTGHRGSISSENLVSSNYLQHKVTYLNYLKQFELLAIGSKRGELILLDVERMEEYLQLNFRNETIVQVDTLPEYVGKDAKKRVFYVLTSKNLYCLKRQRNVVEPVMKRLSAAAFTSGDRATPARVTD